MAKDKLTDYDATASGNLDVGGVSVAEGMLPSGVNNAIRELMSHQADAFGAGTPLYVDQTNNRVGIGNAAPTVPLDVTGAASVSGALTAASATVTGDLTVDTNTLHVDSTNNRVGISNASPSVELDVTGAAKVSGDLTVDTDTLYVDSTNNRVGVGGSDTQVFTGVGGGMKLVVIGNDSATTVASNSDAGIAIVNTNQTAGNLAGLHFARADTDDSPNYAGASIVARFPDAQVTGQYPKGDLAFLTSTSANNAPSEKMRIEAAGDILVKTADARIGSDVGAVEYGTSTSNSVRFYSNNSARMTIENNGNWKYSGIGSGSGTYALKWNASTGAITFDTSARQVKDNIVDCSYGLSEVLQLQPRQYNRNDDGDKLEIGFVADEVSSVMPEFVPQVPESVFTGNEDDTTLIDGGVNYEKLVAVLTKAIQELEARIVALENA